MARELMIKIVEDPVDESMSGTLWLFPFAVCHLPISGNTHEGEMVSRLILTQGGVLILIALRSWAWSKPESRAQYAIYTTQMIIGMGIGLLGLLDIASRRLALDDSDGSGHERRLNPLYVLLEERLPLFVVLGAYGLSIALEILIGRTSARRQRRPARTSYIGVQA